MARYAYRSARVELEHQGRVCGKLDDFYRLVAGRNRVCVRRTDIEAGNCRP